MKTFLTIILSLILISASCSLFAANAKVTNDFTGALKNAKSQGKLLFVSFGREACGNCQNLKSLIKSDKVQIPEEKFIYVDLNCDNEKDSNEFYSRFRGNGNTLPFVGIADSDGKQLSVRTGYGTAEEYQKFISEAEKKAKK